MNKDKEDKTFIQTLAEKKIKALEDEKKKL